MATCEAVAHAADSIEIPTSGQSAGREPEPSAAPATSVKGRIELHDGMKSYSGVTAVDHVDLTVAAGS